MNETYKMYCQLFLFFTLTFFGLAQSEVELETSLKGVPQKAVTTSRGFLEPCVFYKEYVLKSIPVVMKSALSEFMSDLDVSRLSSNPDSFTTYLEVRYRDGVPEKNLSIYQIWNTNKAENGYVDTFIPTSIKAQIHLPKSLRSKSVSQGMRSSRFDFSSGEKQWDFGFNPLHRLLCQFGGYSTHQLVAPSSIISQKDHSPPLAASEFHTATLNERDCIFIPSGWAWQKNSSGKYLSVSFHWTLDSEGNECEEQTTKPLLTSLFPDDPPLDLLSVIHFNELHHFIKEYYLSPNLMDLDSFMNAVRQMFHQLDYNTDDVLSKEDFQEISKEGLQELAGKLDDRFADFADIMEDAKVEKKGSLFIEARKATNSADEIRKLIEDSFSEIFSDIDTAKTKGNFKNIEQDPEKEEMKIIEKLLKDSIASTSKKDEL